jgi:hypothetical protein
MLLSAFICVHPCFNGPAFGASSTPVAKDAAFDKAGEALEKAKGKVQELREKWDKARMETTLYDKRAKRAYQKWVKAAKKAKDQAKTQKENAELELQLSIEKRKLAFNEWQAAQLRAASKESELKALDQDKDTRAIQEKIKKLEDALGRQTTVDGPQKK